MEGEATNCETCGLPFADDNETTHECPPGFEQSPWTPETLELIMDALVGCLVRNVWKAGDPRRDKAERLIRVVYELRQLELLDA